MSTATGGAEQDWIFLKVPLPENCHYLTCLLVPWKTLLLPKLPLCGLTLSSSRANSLLSGQKQSEATVKHCSCLRLWTIFGANNSIIKKLKKKSWGMRCPWGLWKAPTYSWESTLTRNLCTFSGKARESPKLSPLANL